MKKLTVIRHAKSSWSEGGLTDFDRPLNKRGKRDAPLMASHYSDHTTSVDQIVSSPALRAITTAGFFADAYDFNKEDIVLENQIYDAHPDTLLKLISNFKSEWNHVMIFGHNPGFSYLIGLLTSEMINIPTCSISEIELHIEDWSLISEGIGRLVHYDYPKNHTEMQ